MINLNDYKKGIFNERIPSFNHLQISFTPNW
jgi:hypothetical protein